MEQTPAQGCVFSKYDVRDYKLKSVQPDLPKEFSCDMTIPIKNQGLVCSCVAFACSSILEYHMKYYEPVSTNFIYGIRKELYNQEGKGMYLRDGCKIITNYGSPYKEYCPGNNEIPRCYEIASKAMDDEEVMKNAWQQHTLEYFRCNSVEEVKHAIYNHGPVLAGYNWYSDYRVKDGKLVGDQKKYTGGHALVIYGWNEVGFFVQNSWGSLWGKRGKCVIPYSIPFREAWGLIDDLNVSNIKEPKKNKFMDILYKIFNWFVNLFRSNE